MTIGKIFTLILPLFFSCFPISAQQVTISGYVTEKSSGERLVGAVVYVPERKAGTATNNFGFYSLTLPADSVSLVVSYVGYKTKVLHLKPQNGLTTNIELEPAKMLEEVLVTAQKDALEQRTQMSAIDLPIETIKSLPAFLGEVDIMKAIQLLPGVQSGNEGSSGLYIRGGGPDQNLILLDGVPVYNAAHLFGFFSVFNADAIKSVEVIKGGFPARYGGRLSSVIDINMKDGDKNKIRGEGGIGLIASRFTLEGPLQKNKSSFMVSGRRTYYDLLTRPFMPANMNVGYYFYDLNGKLNFNLGKKDHLYVSGYLGNDKFHADFANSNNAADYTSSFKSNLGWGNITGVVRWNHVFGPKVFGNLTAYYSRYRFLISTRSKSSFENITDDYLLKYTSGINDKAVKYDIDWLPGVRHYIKTGVGLVHHTYKPGAQQTRIQGTFFNLDTLTGAKAITSLEADAYIEDDIKLTDLLKVNLGLHWTGFSVNDRFYNSLQPRVALRYMLSDKLSAKASFVQMNQFIHLLTNSGIGLPTDLWVPVTAKIPVQRSHQGAMGLAYTYNSAIEVSVEGYYKTMENVIEYKEGANFLNNADNWESKVAVGNGHSYGAELFLQKKKGRFTGLAGYTWSRTVRQFPELNNGKQFPYRYDRRHDIKLAGVYKIAKDIECSAEWVYGTGNALTVPLSYYKDATGNIVQVYGSRNGYRMPAYHRADVSVKFIKETKRWERAWVISVYNVYNRRNPYFIYPDFGSKGVVFKQVSLFPMIPTISYQFKF